MVNKKYFFCLIIALLMSRIFSEEIVFRQKIEWIEDSYASEYEVHIQDDEKNTVFKRRTNKTQLEVSLPSGNYKYQIQTFDLFGNPASKTDWLSFKILKAIKPDVKGFTTPQLNLVKGNSLEASINASGIKVDSKIELVSSNKKNRYIGKIVSVGNILEDEFDPKNIDPEKTQVYKIVFPSTEIPEGKYFLEVQNEGGLKFRGKDIFVRYAIQPVITNFEPTILYTVKGILGLLNVSGGGFFPDCKFTLESTDGVYKVSCDVKSLNVKDGNGNAELTFTTNRQGQFNLVVQNSFGQKDSTGVFVIAHTIQPHVFRVFDGKYKLNSLKSFTVVFDANGIISDTTISLVSIPDGKKSIRSKNFLQREDGFFEAEFPVSQIQSGTYTLMAENTGGFSDTGGKFEFVVIPGVDLNLGLGLYSGTINLLYNNTLPDYSYGTFTLGLLAEISVIPFKTNAGYFGFGLNGEFTNWKKDTDVLLQSGNVTLNAIYQKPFALEKFRVQVSLGGGLGIFNQIKNSSSNASQSPLMQIGVSGIYYPIQHLYLNLGFDFYHIFSSIPTGLFVPHFSIGGRL